MPEYYTAGARCAALVCGGAATLVRGRWPPLVRPRASALGVQHALEEGAGAFLLRVADDLVG
ncbi:hypothetical protein GCM10010486_50060 [Nonomuraea roseoviolacea subsp. carminata]